MTTSTTTPTKVTLRLWSNWNKETPKWMRKIRNFYVYLGTAGFLTCVKLAGVSASAEANLQNWWLALGVIIGALCSSAAEESTGLNPDSEK